MGGSDQGTREFQDGSSWPYLAPYCLPVLTAAPLSTGQLVESPCQVGHRPLSLRHLDLSVASTLRPSAPSWVQASLECAGERRPGPCFCVVCSLPFASTQALRPSALKSQALLQPWPSASKSPAAADEGPVLAPQRPEAPRALTPLCSETPVYPCLG